MCTWWVRSPLNSKARAYIIYNEWKLTKGTPFVFVPTIGLKEQRATRRHGRIWRQVSKYSFTNYSRLVAAYGPSSSLVSDSSVASAASSSADLYMFMEWKRCDNVVVRWNSWRQTRSSLRPWSIAHIRGSGQPEVLTQEGGCRPAGERSWSKRKTWRERNSTGPRTQLQYLLRHQCSHI